MMNCELSDRAVKVESSANLSDTQHAFSVQRGPLQLLKSLMRTHSLHCKQIHEDIHVHECMSDHDI